MGTDFFDDDLLKNPRPARAEKAGSETQPVPRSPIDASRPRLVRQKEEITTHVTGAATEIERLRHRQEALEREKRNLESLSRKQDEYETTKRDIMEKLDKSIATLEREDEQVHRMVELLSETIARFKTTLAELREINEETWTDESFQVDLDRALVRVDIAVSTYKKAIAKIEATGSGRGGEGLMQPAADRLVAASGLKLGFADWMRIGLAFSIPFIAAAVIMFAAYVFLTGIL